MLELQFHSPSVLKLLCIALGILAVKLTSTVIYNLYFHPLSKIPGPKLAAATYLYQTYFGLVGGSRFYLEIQRLHEIYGPMVRITPDEVHMTDVNNYELIHFVGSKYAKSPLYESFGIGYSTFSAKNADTHRARRSGLNPFFSRKMVLQLEHIVQEKAEKLYALTTEAFAAGKAMNLHYGFRAVSVDVVTEYAFAECYDLLDKPDLGAEFVHMFHDVGPNMWVFLQWPGLQSFALSLPESVASAMSAPIASVIKLSEHCRQQCIAVKAAMDSGQAQDSPSIFQTLLSPKEKDEDYIVPTVDELKDEAFSILTAAADTTGMAMTMSLHRTVSDPEIYAKVRQELETAFPDPNASLDFVKLEALPYLSGIIKEGLRLSFGVPSRLPREVPEGGQTFNDVFIPAGNIVSMSSWLLHHDPSYFPNPEKFDPDRWLNITEARRIDKAFVPFGKGTRACVGMPLAYCELYVTLGTLLRRFPDLKSNHLREKDLVFDDYFAGYYPHSARKFQVTSGGGGKSG